MTWDPNERPRRLRRSVKIGQLKEQIESYRLHYAVDDKLIDILRLMTELIEESKKK